MSTPFNSPCTNHDENCPLDLKRLKLAIKHGSDPKAWERYQAAEEHLKKLIAAKAPEPAISSAKADLDKASKAYYESAAERSSEGKTILYTIRAHHRGRLHGHVRRNPDGTKSQITKEDQKARFDDPKWSRMLKKFLKTTVPAQPTN